MPEDSEKVTDHILLSKFEEVFKCRYNTSGNKKLFGSKLPDGWFEYDNNLFIIENKRFIKKQKSAYDQVVDYYNIAKETEEFKKYKECYLIVCCETDYFKYDIYSTINGKIEITDKKIEDLKKPGVDVIFDFDIAYNFDNYLRINGINLTTKKIFFVTAILMCRKIDPELASRFNEKTNEIIIANYLTKLIKDSYNDALFAVSFKFMKRNINKNHLYEMIKLLDFDIKYYTNDVLNQFYSEFMIYNATPKKGIVLTPHDIVELMVKELNIKPGESVMDCCTGTGSFLIEASKYTDNLIGCENKQKLYTVVKSNFILHDLDTDKLYYNNCFDQKFEMYDHIILNPPYKYKCSNDGITEDIYGWREFDEEQKYIIYQLQHLKENGTGCFIIPRKNFNNSAKDKKQTDKFKKVLLEKCQILKIYNCNDNVFYPNAKVECIICVFKKCKPVEKYETEIIDYSNDGYISKNNNRYKISEPNINLYKEVLYYENDWNYNKCHYMESIKFPDIKTIYFTAIKNKFLYNVEKYKIIKDYQNIIKEYKLFASKENDFKKAKLKEWIDIKIGDYFDFVKGYKGYTQTTDLGIYPLITRSDFNNGITRFIKVYSLEGDFITIAPSGSSGATFHQEGKFAVDKQIKVLKLKKDKVLDLDIFSVVCGYFLKQKYNYNNGIPEDKMLNEVIYYPVIELIE